MKLFGRSKGKSEDSNSNKKTERELDLFSKYLSLWVGVCIVDGTLLGYFFPSLSTFLTKLQFANVSVPRESCTFDNDVSNYAQGKIL